MKTRFDDYVNEDKSKREKIFVNGYEYWMDRTKDPIMFYESENSKNGISIESVSWTRDEKRQIMDFIKYGRVNESKNVKGIKLGDTLVRVRVDSHGMVIGYPKHKVRDYRVIGLNPNLKLQEVVFKNGDQELGEIEEFDWSMTDKLRPMFPTGHLVHNMFGGDWSHVWVGDF